MVSLSVHLDAPPGTTAWVVLGSTERWGPSAELYWRRQIHPGWNHLTWDDLFALAGRGPLTIRLEAAAPLTWMVGEPRVAVRYGLLPRCAGSPALADRCLGLVAGVRWLHRARVPRPDAWVMALLALGAIALGLRLHTLASQSFWFDEVLTHWRRASRGLRPRSSGPPLQYLVPWAMTGDGLGRPGTRAVRGGSAGSS
jgi:hypothetical protein